MSLETLAAIREIRPRAAALQARLRADVHAGAHALESLAHAAVRGDARARDVLIAFSWFRASQVVSDLVGALADAAPECPLFRTTTAARCLSARARMEPLATSFAHRFLLVSIPGIPGLSYLMRRRIDAPLRERVLRDPRAPVIARVLDGNVEIRDVLRIAARRPSTAELACTVASSRFVRELCVREALVRNPFTPTWLSLVLLPTLRVRMVDLALAHDEVREYARALVGLDEGGRGLCVLEPSRSEPAEPGRA
jgi:hypothetical protein